MTLSCAWSQRELILASQEFLKFPVLHWQRGQETTPLLVAVGRGDINIVAYLALNTKKIGIPPNDQALCVAARYGHTNVANYLIERNVSAVPRGGCGSEALPEDVAKKYQSFSLADVLQRYRLERQAGTN